MRELFALERQTREAADTIERSGRELPELADLLNSGLRRPVLAALTWFARHRHRDPDGAAIPEDLAADTAVDALIHALVPHAYLGGRP